MAAVSPEFRTAADSQCEDTRRGGQENTCLNGRSALQPTSDGLQQ